METVRIRDPGSKKVGSGIRDKHPGSATLQTWIIFYKKSWLLKNFLYIVIILILLLKSKKVIFKESYKTVYEAGLEPEPKEIFSAPQH